MCVFLYTKLWSLGKVYILFRDALAEKLSKKKYSIVEQTTDGVLREPKSD